MTVTVPATTLGVGRGLGEAAGELTRPGPALADPAVATWTGLVTGWADGDGDGDSDGGGSPSGDGGTGRADGSAGEVMAVAAGSGLCAESWSEPDAQPGSRTSSPSTAASLIPLGRAHLHRRSSSRHIGSPPGDSMPRMSEQSTHVAVRPMTEADDLAALNQGNPLGWLPAMWADMAAASPDLPMHRFVGLLAGRPAGFAFAIPIPVAQDGYGAAALHVLPADRKQGVGAALRRAVADVLRGAVPGVSYSYAEDDPDATAAVVRWRLREAGRHSESVLDLAALDRDAFGAAAATADTHGITLEPLAEDLDDDGWHALHDYAQARMRETPDAAGGGGEFPYDVFRAAVDAPWMLMTAERDGVRVGVTFVARRGGGDTTVNTMFTGVSPEARGLGLSVALKARHALLMAERGLTRLYTQNMTGNAPILAANARLGFTRDSGYVDVVEALG